MSYSLDTGETRGPEGPRVSTWAFRGVVLLVFAILIAQLWRLQVVDGRAYVGRSSANWLRSAAIAPQRGVIYDRSKLILAANAPIFVVSITPADVPRGRIPEIAVRLANELRVPADAIQNRLSARKARRDYSPYDVVIVAYDVDREAVMRLAEHQLDMPGVQISVDSTRRYSNGPLLAHLIGYMGSIPADEIASLTQEGYSPGDVVGAAGLEQQYEKDLRGVPGKRLFQVGVTGQEVGEIRRDDAQPGRNLLLTLDINLQRDVQRILEEGTRGSAGAAIVMDPRNGEVLAMVSTPTFDNNIIGDPKRSDELSALLHDEKNQPMFPRAYGGTYAPGSVFKLVTGSAALQEGVATKDTQIESKGQMQVQRDDYPGATQTFTDTWAYGQQTFLQGLANSSNIYFYWLGGGFQEGGKTIFKGLGVDNLARYARAYGYGSPTGLDLPGEKDGTIPDPTWKQVHKGERWYTGDTYNMSIGQGDVLVTPLQVANITNAIANGGTIVQPHLAKAELDADGKTVKEFQTRTRPAPVDAGNLATMRQAMEFAFEGPWLKWFKIPELRVGGKTGTAQYAGPLDAKGELPTHGWFTGFAPADAPEVTVTVFVENGSGTLTASPIGARILRRYFSLPDVPPNPPDLPTVTTPAPAPPR